MSPLGSQSPQPRVNWNPLGCSAVCVRSDRTSAIDWMTDPVVELLINKAGTGIQR